MGLVESYLRLNGYFTLPEFQVQHPVPGQPGKFETATDLDILAVRFPWAAETVGRHQLAGEEPREILLADDPVLAVIRDVPDILIGEVKEGASELNRRLRTPEVLHAALRRTGCCPEEHIAQVSALLLQQGEALITPHHGVACRVRLASFCGYVEEPRAPAVLTITLGHILHFIEDRLAAYRPILRSAQFRDPTLGMLKLLDKLDLGLAPKIARHPS